MKSYHIAVVAPYSYQPFRSINQLAKLLQSQFEALGYESSIIRPPSLIGDLSEGAGGFHRFLAGTERALFSPARFAGKVASLQKKLKKQNKELIVVLTDQGLSHLAAGINDLKVIQVVNDMIAIRAANGEFGGAYSWMQRFSQSINLNGLQYSKHFLVFSEATKDDLRRYIPNLKPDQVRAVGLFSAYPYTPVDPDVLQQVQEELWRRFRLAPQPYFLHVGSSAWYKNREGLIALMGELKKKRNGNIPALVFAGESPTAKMRDLIDQNSLEFYHFANPTDRELNALYTGAMATILPSFAEGFCWPALEALQAASPLVVSLTPCLAEHFGAAATATLPDPTGVDVQEWVDACVDTLDELLEADSQLIDDLTQEGLAHAQDFNENRFQQTLRSLIDQ